MHLMLEATLARVMLITRWYFMKNPMLKSGIFWMIVSVLAFSIMQLFVSMTSPEITVFQQLLVRNIMGILVAGYFIKKEKVSWLGSNKDQPSLFGRSIAGYLGVFFFFAASRTGAIADATIINRTGPFFTTLFSVLFLKENATRQQWAALLIIFAGGLIAGNPSFDSSALPMILAMFSAVGNGVAYTLLSYLGGRVHPMTVIMHFSVFSVLASIPFLVNSFVMPAGMDFINLFMIGLMGSSGQIGVTLAYKYSPATEVSVFDQLSVVVSILLGWIFLDQAPSWHMLTGGAIVIGTSVWIYHWNNQRLRRRRRLNPGDFS